MAHSYGLVPAASRIIFNDLTDVTGGVPGAQEEARCRMRYGVWDPHENPGRRPENRTFRAPRDGVLRLSMRSPTMAIIQTNHSSNAFALAQVAPQNSVAFDTLLVSLLTRKLSSAGVVLIGSNVLTAFTRKQTIIAANTKWRIWAPKQSAGQ